MKHIFKLFLCISILITSVSATEISLVDVQDTQTLSVLLSEEVNLEEGIVEADVKVLKDVTIETAEKSVDDSKRVIVDFPEPLKENTSYSLLSLLGAEGSIDFSTGTGLTDVVIENEGVLMDEQSIESITIINSEQVEVLYSTEVLDSMFEYKLLSELDVSIVENESNLDNRITISLMSTIELESNYILIILSLIDEAGNEISLENSIFDFMSPEYMDDTTTVSATEETETEVEISDETIPSVDVLPEEDISAASDSIADKIAARNAERSQEEATSDTEEVLEETPSESISEEIIEEDEQVIEEDIELTAAPEDPSLIKNTIETAMSASSTPDTGSETWVLIVLTLFINTFYYFTRRKVA